MHNGIRKVSGGWTCLRGDNGIGRAESGVRFKVVASFIALPKQRPKGPG